MKNTKTFRQLEYECLAASKVNADDIQVEARREIINDMLMKIYNLINSLLDPFYNFQTTLTPDTDQETIGSPNLNGGVFTVVNGGAGTISRSSGTFVLNSIISVTILDVGDYLSIKSFIARITSTGAVATFERLSGDIVSSTYTFGGNVIGICGIVKSLSASSADLSSLYIQDIIAIYDNVTRINQKTFDRFRDSAIFRELTRDPAMEKRIGYYWHGDTIDFFTGASATALGVITMEYRGKPTLYSEATEDSEILIPPEYNQMLKDEVVAAFIGKVKGESAVPSDLGKEYAAMAARKAKDATVS